MSAPTASTFRHFINQVPFKCERTGRTTESVFTDHSRPGVYNACEHCHDDNRTLGECLHDLNEQRGKSA